MLYTVLRTLIVALGCTAAGVAAMHMLQAQRYQIPELRKLLRRNSDKTLRPDVLIAAAVAVIDWYLPILLSLAIQKEGFREALCRWLALGLFAIVAFLLFWLRLRLARTDGADRRSDLHAGGDHPVDDEQPRRGLQRQHAVRLQWL